MLCLHVTSLVQLKIFNMSTLLLALARGLLQLCQCSLCGYLATRHGPIPHRHRHFCRNGKELQAQL
jgi:hypothetical protein